MKEIPLSQDKVTIVDDEDYQWLSQWKWYSNGYAARQKKIDGKQKTIFMHRAIYEHHYGKISDSFVVDHIDRDKLNNQLNNLRLATVQQNQRNRSKRSDNSSGIVGVRKQVYKKKLKMELFVSTVIGERKFLTIKKTPIKLSFSHLQTRAKSKPLHGRKICVLKCLATSRRT